MKPASCSSCRYSTPAHKPGLPDALECRRLPPNHEAARIDRWSQPRYSGWPGVRPEDWCGEWVPSGAVPNVDDCGRRALVFQLPPQAVDKSTASPGKALMTGRETAEYLAINEKILSKWRCHGGGPPSVKMSRGRRGGSVRYAIADVDQWLADRRIHHTSEKSVAEQAWVQFVAGKLDVPYHQGR